MRSVIAVVIALSCAGCGSASAVDSGRSAAPPYEGPLTADAAVDALECDGTKPYVRSTGDYDDGLATVQSSPQDAFDNYIEESGIGYSMPLEGYRDRAQRRQAVPCSRTTSVTAPRSRSSSRTGSVTGHRYDVGWGAVAWASSATRRSFTPEVTDDLGIGVGRTPLEQLDGCPVNSVLSRQGTETLLEDGSSTPPAHVGPGRGDREHRCGTASRTGDLRGGLRQFHGTEAIPRPARSVGASPCRPGPLARGRDGRHHPLPC